MPVSASAASAPTKGIIGATASSITAGATASSTVAASAVLPALAASINLSSFGVFTNNPLANPPREPDSASNKFVDVVPSARVITNGSCTSWGGGVLAIALGDLPIR